MALNPFFLQGSQDEQRLVQNLINEQLQIYGLEVTYIPRKFVNKQTIIEEVQSSRFDDNFSIEAYLNTYEGYSGAGDVMTKFGVSLRDEVTLTISRERFEDFIAPFLDPDDYELGSRPREGDLVYFPLGQRLFEVKFVEHEKPFYQLQKNYTYEIQCELFEYEDEIIDTSIQEIDTQVQDQGFITTLNLVGTGRTATASAQLSPVISGKGYIRSVTVLNDGTGYTSTPTVFISTSRDGAGVNASAVAITTSIGGVHSIKEIILTNAGAGYTQAPDINIVGGGGSGAIATCTINSLSRGVIQSTITDEGTGYTTIPQVTVSSPAGIGGKTAKAVATINNNAQVSGIRIVDPGQGYVNPPDVTIGNPNVITGRGNFELNDLVVGQNSLTEARVKEWDVDTKVLKVSNVGIGTTVFGFTPGEELRIQIGLSNIGERLYKTEHVSRYTRSVYVSAGSSVLSIGYGNTSNVNVGDSVGVVTGFIGAGVTVHSIGNYGYVYMSEKSINTSGAYKTISFGSTVFTGYNIREYDDRDIYDSYSDNDEFETEADAIIDFAESNPFGTF